MSADRIEVDEMMNLNSKIMKIAESESDQSQSEEQILSQMIPDDPEAVGDEL